MTINYDEVFDSKLVQHRVGPERILDNEPGRRHDKRMQTSRKVSAPPIGAARSAADRRWRSLRSALPR